MAGLTIEILETNVVAAADWKSFRYTESIGQPDEMSADVVGFTVDPGFTQPVQTLFGNPYSIYYTVCRLDDDILFSGLVRNVRKKKPATGAMTYSLTGNGWQFLMPRRLVGVPDGNNILMVDDGGPDGPQPVFVDPAAIATPTPGGVRGLFDAYWVWPQIDTDTFVTDVMPPEAAGDDITWSGSDLEGAVSDLAHAGSAAALWWFAHDSPDEQSAFAPHLAFHWGLVVLPDEGDSGDDLVMGFPSADLPTLLAPFNLDNDHPDGITSIMPNSLDFTIDYSQQVDGVYVRGATGWTWDANAPWPNPPVGVGGTGWAMGIRGDEGGVWGEEYLDAPAAITREERDAFGLATIAARARPQWSGTATVVGVDGWHKGQSVQVTDADYGFDARWFLIRAVSMSQHDPFSTANEYTLTLGDTLSASLGYALREQRLKEQRQEIAPASQFIPYMGDLQPLPGDTLIVRMQLATDSGVERKIKGVTARWRLIINGVWAIDPFDSSGLFWLSDQTTVTNEVGQVTATMHAAAGAVPDADAANVKADVVLP